MGRRGPIARISRQVDPRRGRLCPREAMLDVATHQFRQLEFQSLRADLGAALHRPGANDPDNGPRQHVEPLPRHPGQVGAIDGYFLSAKEVRDHLDRAGQLRRAWATRPPRTPQAQSAVQQCPTSASRRARRFGRPNMRSMACGCDRGTARIDLRLALGGMFVVALRSSTCDV